MSLREISNYQSLTRRLSIKPTILSTNSSHFPSWLMVAEKIACENSLDFAGSWQIQAKSKSLDQSQHYNKCLRGIFDLLCYRQVCISFSRL